ncbi:MAG: 2-phospho-L-lactate transferase [Thermomicrobiales bacterium]
MIVALAGGVGGAKLAQGLMAAPGAGGLTVVVNTADDFDLFGLRICPDIDTVLYTLGGIANPETGWGIAGDTFATLDALAGLGRDPWFRLGDRDFATHIHRTERLRQGASPSAVTAELAMALGIVATVLPMTDDRVATVVETPAGALSFQDYFVRRRQADDVLGVTFEGIDAARPTSGVEAALAGAEVIIFCPSNPIVSIGPILALPGARDALVASPAPVVAISPIVGGRALKGPADKMLASLGSEVSPLGVARLYAGLIDGMVLDVLDAGLAGAIGAELGIATLVTDTVMGGFESRRDLAARVLAFGRSLAPVTSDRA